MRFRLVILALVLLTLSRGVARADEIGIAGTAAGCFSLGGAPCTPFLDASLPGLFYGSSQFRALTSGGSVALDNPAPVPSFRFNNLGLFSLHSFPTFNGVPVAFNGTPFQLLVTFEGPRILSGPGIVGNTFRLTGTITGAVTGANQGEVLVDFDNSEHLFTFSGGTASFRFSVNDLIVRSGERAVLTGQVTHATIPEPVTLLLFSIGLAGTAGAVRRRRKAQARQ